MYYIHRCGRQGNSCRRRSSPMRARRSTPAPGGTPGSPRAASRASLTGACRFRRDPRPVRTDGADRRGARRYLERTRASAPASTSRRCRAICRCSKPPGWSRLPPGNRDARRRAVWLTERGAQSLEAGLADWKRAHGELAKRLDPEAARRLAVAAEALEEG